MNERDDTPTLENDRCPHFHFQSTHTAWLARPQRGGDIKSKMKTYHSRRMDTWVPFIWARWILFQGKPSSFERVEAIRVALENR